MSQSPEQDSSFNDSWSWNTSEETVIEVTNASSIQTGSTGTFVEWSTLSNMTKESGSNEDIPRTPKVQEHIAEEFEGQSENNQECSQARIHSSEQSEKSPEDHPEFLRLQPGRRSMQYAHASQNQRSVCLTPTFQLNESNLTLIDTPKQFASAESIQHLAHNTDPKPGKKSGQSEAVIVWSPQFQISECENDSNFGLMLPIVPRTNHSETYSTVPRHRASRSLGSNIQNSNRRLCRIILTPERRRPVPLQLPLDSPISNRYSFQDKETDQDNQDLSIASTCLLDKAFIEEDEANSNSVDRTIQTLRQILEDIPKLEQELPANVVSRTLKLGKRNKLTKNQLFGIQWTLWREHKFPGGGIMLNKNLNTAAVVAACAFKSNEVSESVDNLQESHPGSGIISRSTLLICCNKSLNKLETGIRSVTRGRISLYVHKGAHRTINAQKLGSHQIVLTTYSVLLAEFNAKCLHPSPLKQVYWERIVLDQGDIMRNTKAVTTQVITENIRGRHCWVVLNNWPREYAPQNFKCIIKFLKLAPFDDDEVWDSVFGKSALKTKESKEYWEAIRKSLVLPQIL